MVCCADARIRNRQRTVRHFMVPHDPQLAANLKCPLPVVTRRRRTPVRHLRLNFPDDVVLETFWQGEEGLAGIPGWRWNQFPETGNEIFRSSSSDHRLNKPF